MHIIPRGLKTPGTDVIIHVVLLTSCEARSVCAYGLTMGLSSLLTHVVTQGHVALFFLVAHKTNILSGTQGGGNRG